MVTIRLRFRHDIQRAFSGGADASSIQGTSARSLEAAEPLHRALRTPVRHPDTIAADPWWLAFQYKALRVASDCAAREHHGSRKPVFAEQSAFRNND
jgi:hypothetical protein